VWNDRDIVFRVMKQVPNDGVLYKVLKRSYSLLFHYLLVNIFSIFLGFIYYFIEPNEASPANVDAAKMFRESREKFDDMAKRSVRKTLGL
jgi:ubiquitin-protein ligase